MLHIISWNYNVDLQRREESFKARKLGIVEVEEKHIHPQSYIDSAKRIVQLSKDSDWTICSLNEVYIDTCVLVAFIENVEIEIIYYEDLHTNPRKTKVIETEYDDGDIFDLIHVSFDTHNKMMEQTLFILKQRRLELENKNVGEQ